MTRKIVTKYEPGIGWQAHYDDPEGLVGWGDTEAAAMEDLDVQVEEDDDHEPLACYLCTGTGIGQHGDPDTSVCYACKGRGYVKNDDGPDPDDERDRRRDDRMTGDWT